MMTKVISGFVWLIIDVHVDMISLKLKTKFEDGAGYFYDGLF